MTPPPGGPAGCMLMSSSGGVAQFQMAGGRRGGTIAVPARRARNVAGG
jgi:hypothetical protein